MATRENLQLRTGVDHGYEFVVLNAAQTAAVDISGWSLSWMMKRTLDQSDAQAAITKTTPSGIVISGTFNADPALNTQVATVVIADTDTDNLAPNVYVHELKRMDAGSEAVLADGRLRLDRSVHRQ